MAKILIVEDDQLIQKLLTRSLKENHYDVVVAANGVEGVALAQSESPDLVLMDMRMPLLNGWEATRLIKASPQTQAIPVIALTAASRAEEQQRCFEAGCDHYLAKPIQLARLLAVIQALLEERLFPPNS